MADHGALPELMTEGAKMNFVQYFCLDVIAIFLIFVTVLLHLIIRIFKKAIALVYCYFIQKEEKRE